MELEEIKAISIEEFKEEVKGKEGYTFKYYGKDVWHTASGYWIWTYKGMLTLSSLCTLIYYRKELYYCGFATKKEAMQDVFAFFDKDDDYLSSKFIWRIKEDFPNTLQVFQNINPINTFGELIYEEVHS